MKGVMHRPATHHPLTQIRRKRCMLPPTEPAPPRNRRTLPPMPSIAHPGDRELRRPLHRPLAQAAHPPPPTEPAPTQEPAHLSANAINRSPRRRHTPSPAPPTTRQAARPLPAIPTSSHPGSSTPCRQHHQSLAQETAPAAIHSTCYLPESGARCRQPALLFPGGVARRRRPTELSGRKAMFVSVNRPGCLPGGDARCRWPDHERTPPITPVARPGTGARCRR